MSDYLRRERHDLHELLLAQLAADRPEDAGGARLAGVRDEDRRVLVETDVGPVLALRFLGRAHDHRLHHLALLDLAGGDGVLDGDHHGVAQAAVAALGPAQDADHERAARARVIGDLDDGFLLDHGRLPALLGPLDDIDDAPAFGLGQRPGLLDADRIARLRAHRVVRRHILGAHDLLAVEPVREPPLEHYGAGLGHLVAHHDARPRLAPAPHAVLRSPR